MRIRTCSAIVAASFVVSFVFSPKAPAQTPSLNVMASNGVKAVLEELQKQAEGTVGRPLAIQFGTSIALTQRIEKGAPFDLVIMTTEAVDALAKEGRVTANTRATLGRSGIGVGIRAGQPKPGIKTPAAMRQTLLRAESITYAYDGASRPYIVKMLEMLGIAEQMKPKTFPEQGSVRSTARVAEGKTEMVLTLISEILPVKGIELVGPLPPEFQSYVSFSGAVGAKATNADAANKLIAFLSGPTVTSTFKAKGIDR
jgi:molybdate transport system substrate-binding protein